MKYQKGDVIQDFMVLLPIKGAAGIESYRVRGADKQLRLLKIGATEAERRVAGSSPLYLSMGENFVSYRYISGETLESKLDREGQVSVESALDLIRTILTQLADLEQAGFSHGNLSADNIMVDLSFGEPIPWVIGFSHSGQKTKETVKKDVIAIGQLLYRMIFGAKPEMPPRLPNREITGLDSHIMNIIYNALASKFTSANDMLEALNHKSELNIAREPIGPGFSAVAGLDDIKKRLQEDVIDILADREGAKAYGIDIPNGMLLYGPPGCGKTFIAERFAEQAAYNYRYVKSSDLASTYVHGSQEKIAALFNESRRNAPTIICFDEFDALVPKRTDVSNASQSAEVNEFLSQLNNCGKDGVFVIATTNRPERIDSAVLRTGRIDYIVYVPLPDQCAREELFRLALKERPTEGTIDYLKLAKKTEGYIASDISALIQDVCREAFRRKSLITTADILGLISKRKPSLSKSDIKEYEKLRSRFENEENARPRVGFVQ